MVSTLGCSECWLSTVQQQVLLQSCLGDASPYSSSYYWLRLSMLPLNGKAQRCDTLRIGLLIPRIVPKLNLQVLLVVKSTQCTFRVCRASSSSAAVALPS